MDFDTDNIPSLDIKINHRNWRIAYAEFFAILSMAEPGEVVCLTGPSRAGKSKLAISVSRILEGDNKFEETGLMNVVMVSAANAGPNGTFSTKSFIQRLLSVIQHPILSIGDAGLDDEFVLNKMDRSTEATLRLALERALVARKVRYLIIDEGQHARYATRGAQAPHAVMDSWKCLAESAGVVLVMIGAYPILDIIRFSPHLIGRKHQVHLPRYRFEEEDIREFVMIIKSYEEIMHLDPTLKNLWENYEMLYEGTFGCIGLLRGWLARASAIASINGHGVTKALLQKTMLSESDLNAIAEEIIDGENLLTSKKGSKRNKSSSRNKRNSIKKSSKKSNAKPFQKKPKRYKPGHRTEGSNYEL